MLRVPPPPRRRGCDAGRLRREHRETSTTVGSPHGGEAADSTGGAQRDGNCQRPLQRKCGLTRRKNRKEFERVPKTESSRPSLKKIPKNIQLQQNKNDPRDKKKKIFKASG